ncbi:hypothetical protein HY993_02430 [Candidatus Micrarchaeota archaeon]|nr:hypothetical protein [Candidatus Micrarchaeota archaeon]
MEHVRKLTRRLNTVYDARAVLFTTDYYPKTAFKTSVMRTELSHVVDVKLGETSSRQIFLRVASTFDENAVKFREILSDYAHDAGVDGDEIAIARVKKAGEYKYVIISHPLARIPSPAYYGKYNAGGKPPVFESNKPHIYPDLQWHVGAAVKSLTTALKKIKARPKNWESSPYSIIYGIGKLQHWIPKGHPHALITSTTRERKLHLLFVAPKKAGSSGINTLVKTYAAKIGIKESAVEVRLEKRNEEENDAIISHNIS